MVEEKKIGGVVVGGQEDINQGIRDLGLIPASDLPESVDGFFERNRKALFSALRMANEMAFPGRRLKEARAGSDPLTAPLSGKEISDGFRRLYRDNGQALKTALKALKEKGEI